MIWKATILLFLTGCRVDGNMETEDADVTVAVRWCSEFRDDPEELKRCKRVVLDAMEAKGKECSDPDSTSSYSD